MVWWVLLVLGVALVGWGVLSAHRLLYPERLAPSVVDPLPACSTHIVTASDGSTFEARLLTHPSPRARVLLCHGYYADLRQVAGLAHCLRERGYEVALIELRGHGNRPGPCTLGIREAEDATAVLRWMRGRDSSGSAPVGVVGLSMGAAVAFQVAACCPEVRAVVADSLYSRLFPVLQQAIRQRYHLPPIPWAWVTWWGAQLVLRRRLASRDPVRLAPRLLQPLFVIQGGEDRRVSPRLAQEFYERWAGPKERWFEPGVGHVGMFARHPQEYCNRVAGFFDRTLA